MAEKKIIVFTHIPKTAGVTLRSIINTEYILRRGKSFTFWQMKDIEKYIALPEAEKKKINIIKGHLHHGVHKYTPYPVQYFTMLRNPIKRTISSYNFASTFVSNPLYKTIHGNNYSLKQILQAGVAREYDNCHIRLLCGETGIPFGKINEGHLEKALHNIEKEYAVIGITEFFDESILLFAKQFNWHTPYYVKENKTRIKTSTEGLDDETMELLKYYNRYDEILYRAGLEIFKKQLEKAGAGFKDEVLKFEHDNKQRETLTRIIFFLVSKMRIFDKSYVIRSFENLKTRIENRDLQ